MQTTSTKALLSWIALVVLISISQPAKMPVFGLIIPFVLLYFALRYTVKLVLDSSRLSNSRTLMVRKWLPDVTAMSAVAVLALQSIGQLTARDVVAVVLLVMLGYFYVHRNGSGQKNKK